MQRETEIVLVNLDYLIYHQGMRLDYGSRAVLTSDGDVAYLLDDLAVPGLTPAGQRLYGRLPAAICYTDAASSYDGILNDAEQYVAGVRSRIADAMDSPERIAAISRARHPDTADGSAG